VSAFRGPKSGDPLVHTTQAGVWLHACDAMRVEAVNTQILAPCRLWTALVACKKYWKSVMIMVKATSKQYSLASDYIYIQPGRSDRRLDSQWNPRSMCIVRLGTLFLPWSSWWIAQISLRIGVNFQGRRPSGDRQNLTHHSWVDLSVFFHSDSFRSFNTSGLCQC